MRRMTWSLVLVLLATLGGFAQSTSTTGGTPPTASQADLNHDRHDLHQDRSDRRQDRRDIRSDRRDKRSDRRDIRSDRRDLRQNVRNGNSAGAAKDRADLRKDHRDLRGDRRDVRYDRHDLRHDRRDVRHDRRDIRQDRRGKYLNLPVGPRPAAALLHGLFQPLQVSRAAVFNRQTDAFRQFVRMQRLDRAPNLLEGGGRRLDDQ